MLEILKMIEHSNIACMVLCGLYGATHGEIPGCLGDV